MGQQMINCVNKWTFIKIMSTKRVMAAGTINGSQSAFYFLVLLKTMYMYLGNECGKDDSKIILPSPFNQDSYPSIHGK